MRGFRGAAESSRVGEADRQRQFAELCYLGGVSRHLFGAGEGPAEAVAEAKQDAWNGSTQAGCATKCATTTFGLATVTLRLRFGHRHKSLFDRHKPFLNKDLQKVISD